jgi:hypothetical protein
MILDGLSNSYTFDSSQPYLRQRSCTMTRRTFAIEPDLSEKIDDLVDGHTLEADLLVSKALRRYIEWGRLLRISS